MKRIHAHSLGLVFGTFLAVWHSGWALLVWLGGAQPLLDFIFRLHMIVPPYKVAAFNLATAASLVAVTAAIGYVFGGIIGLLWNAYAAPIPNER